jgi:hypothetical protein
MTQPDVSCRPPHLASTARPAAVGRHSRVRHGGQCRQRCCIGVVRRRSRGGLRERQRLWGAAASGQQLEQQPRRQRRPRAQQDRFLQPEAPTSFCTRMTASPSTGALLQSCHQVVNQQARQQMKIPQRIGTAAGNPALLRVLSCDTSLNSRRSQPPAGASPLPARPPLPAHPPRPPPQGHTHTAPPPRRRQRLGLERPAPAAVHPAAHVRLPA